MNNELSSWRIMPNPVSESEIAEVYKCDVLIVGASHAGTMAMHAAVDAGAEVIAIDKKEENKFHVNGAEVGHINSDYLRARGVPVVDPIELFNEWLRRAGNRANQSLVMRFCQNCGSAFDYYISVFSDEEMQEVRVKYWPVPDYYTGSMNGYKTWSGTALFPGIFLKGSTTLTECIRRHHKKAVEIGAQIHYATEAMYPIMNGTRVEGIVARNGDGQYVKYLAGKGVILSAGDFGGNEEMSKELLCDVADLMDEDDRFFSVGMGDGKGIQIGVWAGGCLESRPVATMGGNTLFATGMTEGFGCLWLDHKGRRYCNEMYSGDSVITGIACNQEKHGPFYTLFDSDIARHLQYGTPCHSSFDTSSPEAFAALPENMKETLTSGRNGYSKFRGIRGSVAYAANTWAEIAEYLELDEEAKKAFLESIERYNKLCKEGRDVDFGKEPQLMIALDKAPFYAVKIPKAAPGGSLCTVGGLVTNENQQVLNKAKDPIRGLFASGNCCGRRFGAQYSTPIAGVSIGMAITLGYEAGRYVACL